VFETILLFSTSTHKPYIKATNLSLNYPLSLNCYWLG